ncbi:hypothetical protein H8E77_18870 [bacterium]|nr:hypothetical protein [bacterium]
MFILCQVSKQFRIESRVIVNPPGLGLISHDFSVSDVVDTWGDKKTPMMSEKEGIYGDRGLLLRNLCASI